MATVLEIIVVEDHDVLRDELVWFLTRPGWAVRGVDCGEALDVEMHKRPAQIVILDLNLPFEDGMSIAKRLRTSRPELGIVMLTARVMHSDRAKGYDVGADVYLTKPANVDELESVIRNLSRRLAPATTLALSLDMAHLKLIDLTGREVTLTLNEANFLYHLCTAKDRQLDTDVLLGRLNNGYLGDGGGDGDGQNLRVFISRLRQKITKYWGDIDLIKAVRGQGYKLHVPITLR